MGSMQERPNVIMATVYLKSQSGRSFLRERKAPPIDQGPYLPLSETTEKAISELQKLGFKLEARGITLSISGPPELFELICGVKIKFEERMLYKPGKTEPQKLLLYRSSQPVMHIQNLDDIIEGIVMSIPGIPLESHDLQE